MIKVDAGTNRPRGFGFVNFADQEGHDAALEGGKYHVILGKRTEIKGYANTTQRANRAAALGGTNNANPESSGEPLSDEAIIEKMTQATKRYTGRTFRDVYAEYDQDQNEKRQRRY